MAEKKKTPAKKLSFGEAVDEVEAILDRLEEGEIDIDELSAEVKRAVELLAVCRDKLERTENEVGELVAGLRAEDAGNKPAAVADDTEAEASDEGLPF